MVQVDLEISQCLRVVSKYMPGVPNFTEDVVRRQDGLPFANGVFADSWIGFMQLPADHETTEKQHLCQTVVAIKSWRVTRLGDSQHEEFMTRYGREIMSWSSYRHRNIVPCLGVVAGHRGVPDTLMPYYKHGDVMSYLAKHPTADILLLLSGIASGLSYLHNSKPPVAHGNLKGSNVLVSDSGEACLTDFGTEHLSGQVYITSPHVCEPCRWMAPEIIDPPSDEDDVPQDMVSPKSDVYSFAMTALQMYTKQLPFCHRIRDAAVIMDVIAGRRPNRPSSAELPPGQQPSDNMWDLLQMCWSQDPDQRPTIDVASRLIGLERLDLDSDY